MYAEPNCSSADSTALSSALLWRIVDVARELAAEQVDLYLTGRTTGTGKEKIEQVRAKAAAHGRKIRFGIRLHVIVRETNDEAWQAAERLISHLDDETIASTGRIRPNGFRRTTANGGAT